MTGKELHEFGLALFMTFIEVQNGKLIAVNMNPENGAPNVLVETQRRYYYMFGSKRTRRQAFQYKYQMRHMM
jgi:hypothetical protein